MTLLRLTLAALGILMIAGPSSAQDHSGHGPAMSGHHQGASASTAPSTKALQDANAAMHEAMAIEFTGNPDVDFVRAMIPHHEGAVAMAKVQLQYGTDPEMRKLAEDVVATQELEIAAMKDWLNKNAK